jgi:putative membrane protein
MTLTLCAFAHPPASDDAGFAVLTRWTWDPLVIVGLLASALAYALGARRIRARAGIGGGVRPWHATSFAAGWLVLVAALISPLDALSDALFAAHMAQHELLMLVAAPLMTAARPLATLLWALPGESRERVVRLVQARWFARFWEALTRPFTTLIVHALAIWLWHVPVLFKAALDHELVHAVQHLTFFLSAALFWWAMVHGRYGRARYGLSVLFVFATALHTSILGALLSFGQRLWYPDSSDGTLAWGLEPLEDQQLAGLIMWVPSGLIFIVVAVALFAAWIGEAERRSLRKQGGTI